MENSAVLLLALLLGVALGAILGWLVGRARGEAARADELASAADARADLAQASEAAAQARSEAAQARAETARTRQDVATAEAAAQTAGAAMERARADLADMRSARDTAIARCESALRRAEEIAADRDDLVNRFKVLTAENLERQGKAVDEAADRRLRETDQLLEPVRQSLERFNARLNEVEQARVQLATELRGQVQSVQLTGEQLRRETSALTTALRRPHVRGAWGEQHLKRVVELAGMLEYCDFIQQETTHTSSDSTIRPDLKVLLGDEKYVYVDSKVPLAAFLDAQETDDEHVRGRHLELFGKNVKHHVDSLGGKGYWKAAGSTPEFVVLYLPSEALGLEALRLVPDLHEYAATRNVIIATPTTLIAMLRSIAYGWKQSALAKSAAEVSDLGRELYERLGTMGGNFDKVGRSLTAAVKAYNSSVASLEGRVLVTARKFRDLHVTDAELREVGGVDEPLRQIAAPELVDDAVRVSPLIGRECRGLTTVDSAASPLPELESLTREDPDVSVLVDQAREDRPGRRDGISEAG